MNRRARACPTHLQLNRGVSCVSVSDWWGTIVGVLHGLTGEGTASPTPRATIGIKRDRMVPASRYAGGCKPDVRARAAWWTRSNGREAFQQSTSHWSLHCGSIGTLTKRAQLRRSFELRAVAVAEAAGTVEKGAAEAHAVDLSRPRWGTHAHAISTSRAFQLICVAITSPASLSASVWYMPHEI